MVPVNKKLKKTLTKTLKKKFVKKVGLDYKNLLLCSLLKEKTRPSLILPSDLPVKTALYSIFKHIQLLKSGVLPSFNGFLVQESKLYLSLVEHKKAEKAQKMLKRVKTVLKRSKFIFTQTALKKEFFNLKSLKVSSLYKKLKKRKRVVREIAEKRSLLSRLFRAKHFYKWLFKRRIRRYSNKLAKYTKPSRKLRRLCRRRVKLLGAWTLYRQKIKYKKVSVTLRKFKKAFPALLRSYSRRFKKFVKQKKKRRKVFRRLLRKRKRKKKWRRRGLFKLFRTRYLYKQKFYIPKHFEINYKTGNIIYLGFTEPKSLHCRIPFRLNLRRLLTHLSS
jgi:hypothetical protein